jgi:hypothetical protein
MPKSTLDETTKTGLFGLFSGDSGSGKSVAALSFPTPYVLDFDKKMPAIAHKHFPDKNIEYDTFGEINDVINKLEELQNFCPYETLIADSATSLGDLSIKTIGKMKGETTKRLFSPQALQGKNKQLEMLSIDYYNGEFRLFRDYFLDTLKSLWLKPGNPKHVILIAHLLTVESSPDLKTGAVTVSRSIMTAGKKVGVYIPSQFDNHWTFGIRQPDLGATDETPKRVCFTSAIGEDFCKSSYNVPPKIDFTNKSLYDELVKYIDFGSSEPSVREHLSQQVLANRSSLD